MRIRILTLILLISLCHTAAGQIQLDAGSSWKYLKGSAAGSLPADWVTSSFTDSGWGQGNAPFRYGDGQGGTLLGDMMNGYSTLYLRSSFNAFSTDRISDIIFSINYDDGFVIWINGTKVLSRNAPAELTPASLATVNHESGVPESFTIDPASVPLFDGTNLICIQAFNVSLNSSDFFFDLGIRAFLSLPEVPDTLSLVFSHQSGFYDNPFDLTLSSGEAGYDLVYTIDGSNPQISATSARSSTDVVLRVDPDITTGRPMTPAFIVRASLVTDGYAPSRPVTQTYIFPDKVVTQTHPGGDWPVSSVNGQWIDLPMDPDVVNDLRYRPRLRGSLLDIPSVSLVTDNANLFSPTSGIYVNAYMHGEEWERQCSLELINPDLSEGFRVNAGVRIRGGASRRPDNPKHAFRLFFRKEYGPGKLIFPLFGDEGAGEFDKVDLRTEQNYSWSLEGDSHNTFLRDIFSRDLQRDMGQPYTRGRYYHLYLNGMYWGLYQTEERADADYAETYFSDSENDYDVIKVSVEGSPYFNEATDGTMDSWQELMNRCGRGFTSNSDYFALEGRDQYGRPVKNTRVLVNIDNLIDYMLVIFYTGNFDAPVSAFASNGMANNYYAILNRKNKGEGFVFLAHDSEHSMFVGKYSLSDGLYEDRVTINDPPMTVTSISNFQPQWLHHRLLSNAEYRVRFADRAYRHFAAGGALSPEKCVDRFRKRKEQVEMAIIAESARWGDAKTTNPRDKYDDWLPEVTDLENNFFPARSEIVVNQLKSAGIYSSLTPPVVKESGIVINTDRLIAPPITITVENHNTRGVIYYTTDGSDPRIIGGAVLQTAKTALSGALLTITGTTIFRSRILDGQTWSALKEIRFSAANEDYSGLKVTEVHYHPEDLIRGNDTVDGKDLEFLELKNTGSGSVNISGITVDTAVYYKVPEGVILPPKGFFVIVSKPEEFYSLYGMRASGNYSGNLSNAGEFILINDKNSNTLVSFAYSDDPPWPAEADGGGYSLVPVETNPTGNPGDHAYWKRSGKTGGSPFADDDAATSADRLLYREWGDLTVYPNPSSGVIVVHLGDEHSGSATLRFIDQSGGTALVLKADNTSVIDLRETRLAPGLYILTAELNGASLRTKLVYLPE
ncbi:MAG: CotH kinase family protein [Bacteroidales bacterium]|nr:CotH kinase family protein [Bacteroidales bacterium]